MKYYFANLIYLCIEWFEVAILDRQLSQIGASSNQKH
jgi:hypothetical protein